MRIDPFPLPVIPVIDIKDGRVVHAVGGARSNYRRIQTPLCEGANPVDIGKALLRRSGARTLYVADLDAIEYGRPSARAMNSLRALGASIWLDAGVRTPGDALDIDARLRVYMPNTSRVVIGTETLADRDALPASIESIGAVRATVSIDLRGGTTIAADENWRGAAPLSVIENVISAGATSLIVLDLARVGAGGGPPSVELLAEIRKRFPTINLYAGGGVRGIADLEALADAGCDGALVASWLHGAADRAEG